MSDEGFYMSVWLMPINSDGSMPVHVCIPGVSSASGEPLQRFAVSVVSVRTRSTCTQSSTAGTMLVS